MRDMDRWKEKVVIQLEASQVAVAILGFILVSIGTFASGVIVGQRTGDRVALPLSLGDDLDLGASDAAREKGNRVLAMASVAPGTAAIDEELARPSALPVPADPTDAARMEVHRQIALARASGSARSLGPVPVAAPSDPAPVQEPFSFVDRPLADAAAPAPEHSGPPTRYALQVFAFDSADPARVVSAQMKASGHAVRIREIADGSGRTATWRVEVGDFGDVREASRFQREFEQVAGYSTVMVPVR